MSETLPPVARETAAETRPRVVWIGAVETVEFAPLVRWLREASQLRVLSAVAALDLAEADAPWPLAEADFIVWATTFSGEFTTDSFLRLRSLAPLACPIVLVGPWCEGELRSGTPLPIAPRLAWHAWQERLPAEFAAWRRGEATAWRGALTQTEDDAVLWQPPKVRNETGERFAPSAGCIGIVGATQAGNELLRDVCRALGFEACSLALAGITPGLQIDGWKGAMVDLPHDRSDWLATLRLVVGAVRPAPVIGLLGFPRPEHRHQALACGAAALVAKPWRTDDLEQVLRRVTGLQPTPEQLCY